MRYLLLALLLAGCVGGEFDTTYCVGDYHSRCAYKVVLDPATQRCTINDPGSGKVEAIYSARHRSGALYCDTENWN